MSIAQNFPTISPSLSLDFANVQALDPRITFARATTATYYGTRTAKAEENLLLYSQEFDNAAWTKELGSITATNETSPGNTLTACVFTESATTGVHGARNAVALTFPSIGSIVTASVYLKKGTREYGFLSLFNGLGYQSIVVDLNTGAVTSTSSAGLTYQTELVANGFVRLQLTRTQATSTTSFLYFGTSNSATPTYDTNLRPSFAGSDTATIIAWGAQLEQRSTVTAYQPTTTQPVTNYVPVLETAASGVARFDHNPVTFESLGLLIEEQRTNLLLQSDDFANASWSKTNTTVTSNTIVAPDGTLTGDALVVTSAGVQCTIAQAAILAAVASTFTCYIKAGSASWVCLGSNQFAADFGWFNVSTGVVGSRSGAVTASQIQAVGNGWYRCSVTGTFTANSNRTISVASADTVFTSPSVGSEVYIWGAQLEAGAFPTSYIPTVASQVTRAADAALMTGANFSSWFNAAQGTIYSESLYYYTGDAGESDATGLGSPVAFGDAIQNQFQPLVLLNASTRVRRSSAYYRTFLQAVSLFDGADNTYLGNTQIKSAVAMAVNDYASSVNGATVRTSAVPFSVVGTRLVIGGNFSQGNFSGTIKKIAYYPIRLSNTNLQALTG